MENKKIMLKSLFMFLSLFFMLSCSVLQKGIERPTVHVQEVKYRPISLDEGQLDSRLLVRNPNGFSVPLRNLSYTLKLNGRVVADSNLSFGKDIPANGTMELRVPIRFRYNELLQSISSFLTQRDIRFQVAGTLDLGLIDIPFSKSGEFTLRH